MFSILLWNQNYFTHTIYVEFSKCFIYIKIIIIISILIENGNLHVVREKGNKSLASEYFCESHLLTFYFNVPWSGTFLGFKHVVCCWYPFVRLTKKLWSIFLKRKTQNDFIIFYIFGDLKMKSSYVAICSCYVIYNHFNVKQFSLSDSKNAKISFSNRFW